MGQVYRPEIHKNKHFAACLLEQFNKYAPFDSILEVGCNAGMNLYNLQNKFPSVRFCGVDINRRAINAGRGIIANKQLDNIILNVGNANNLDLFSNQSMDIVFTSATLMYIGSKYINPSCVELVRIARRRVILFEWLLFDEKSSIQHYGRWVHNYIEIFNNMPKVKTVHVKRIPSNIFLKDPCWEKYGAIIVVELYY